jgi:type I restriction-modification system DNA methylase subunit
MSEKLTNSSDRIKNFGEVYTSKKDIDSMLDLVQHEAERIDSRILEPACGNGNFLNEVLKRKLKLLAKKYKKNQFEYEKNSIVIFSSIYGIDILSDNIELTKNRLLDEFRSTYIKIFKNEVEDVLIDNIKLLLNKNIIHGDALTLKKVAKDEPIIFSEWGIVGEKIKRRDFTFQNLIDNAPFEEGTLFSDLGDDVLIPTPIKEYPLINYFELYKHAK